MELFGVDYFWKIHVPFSILIGLAVYGYYLYFSEPDDYYQSSDFTAGMIVAGIVGLMLGPIALILALVIYLILSIDKFFKKVIEKFKQKRIDKLQYQIIAFRNIHYIGFGQNCIILKALSMNRFLILGGDGKVANVHRKDVRFIT